MKNLVAERKDGIVCLQLRDDLSQNDYFGMREYMRNEFFEKGEKKLVFDCEPVSELPSIAFGVFCSLSRDALRLGGTFGVMHVSAAIRQIMTRTHVDQQVKVYNTWNEVVQAME